MKSGITAIVGIIGFVFSLSLFAEGDPVAGREKAFTCTGCHAAPGMRNVYPSYRVPKIAGQNAEYLIEAMRAYREELRTHATMHAQIAQFADQDIENIAVYFSQINVKPATSVISAFKGDPLAGKSKATLCITCHGEGNTTQSPATPILSGQYEDYIIHSLKSYQSGERENAIMASTVATLNDEDIQDIAAYYAIMESRIYTPAE